MSFGSDDGFDDGIPRDAFYDARQASLNVPLSYVCCWHGCCCCSPVPQLYTANTLTFRCRGRARLGLLYGHTPPAASLSCASSSTASSRSGSKMHVGGERCSLRRRSSSGHTAATYAGWRHSNWMPVLASKLRFTSTCVRRGPRLLWLLVLRVLNATRLCTWADHACINVQVVETRGRTGWAWISSSSRGTRCSGCCGQLASDGRADAMSWSSGCMST